MDTYVPGIGISAGLLMLKWDLLNQHIHAHRIKLQPGDQMNVFINFEVVLRNITLQKNLNDLINFHKRKTIIELESSIINVMANYRSYFKKERCIPKIYYYSTALKCDHQQMNVYNKYYRSYYQNRFMQNPQFSAMGTVLNDIIIPETKLIVSYIPDCYFIESKTFDSSLIPMICSLLSDDKNVIITGDVFDTLYLYDAKFITVYINRRYNHLRVISEIDDAISSIIKSEDGLEAGIFSSELYYRLLLSIKGSKIRNIRSAKGFGYTKFMKLLKDGMDNGIVLKDFESIDSVIELFPEKYREDIKLAFKCTDLNLQYDLLSETDIDNIKAQLIDKVDIVSLEALNNKRFSEFPIKLQELLN